jgi:hypothetical protein
MLWQLQGKAIKKCGLDTHAGTITSIPISGATDLFEKHQTICLKNWESTNLGFNNTLWE